MRHEQNLALEKLLRLKKIIQIIAKNPINRYDVRLDFL